MVGKEASSCGWKPPSQIWITSSQQFTRYDSKLDITTYRYAFMTKLENKEDIRTPLKRGVWNSCSQIYSKLCNSTEGGCSFPSSQLVNGFHICSFKEGPLLNMVPPLEEEVVDHQSEPRGQLQTFLTSIRFPQQLFQIIPGHILNISNFIRVWIHINISDNEE